MTNGQLRVVLRLFSGRPNPEWLLPKEQADDVLGRLRSLPRQQTGFRPDCTGEPDEALGRPKSGYRGFRLFTDAASRRPAFQVYRQLVFDQTDGSVRTDSSDQGEEAVWRTAPAGIAERDNITLADLSAGTGDALIQGVQGDYVERTCNNAPRYIGKPDRFNDFESENNCYNYATLKLNAREGTLPAVPGPSNRRGPYTVAQLQAALDQDKLTSEGMKQPTRCPPHGMHWVAALVRLRAGAPFDVHFLRLDRSGHWSHKDGDDPVTNKDDKCRQIGDLKLARFNESSILAGFYLMHADRVGLIR